jgi:antitoxin MazE
MSRIRIPKPLAADAGLKDDSPVELSLVDGRLAVRPMAEPGVSLEHLLAQVTESNLHCEVNTGSAVGNEIW